MDSVGGGVLEIYLSIRFGFGDFNLNVIISKVKTFISQFSDSKFHFYSVDLRVIYK